MIHRSFFSEGFLVRAPSPAAGAKALVNIIVAGRFLPGPGEFNMMHLNIDARHARMYTTSQGGGASARQSCVSEVWLFRYGSAFEDLPT
jgi:hypothetical protein